ESSESTFKVVEPYVIKYESPAYNEINAADVATVLGEDYWNTTSYTSRWANWNKANAKYEDQYVMVDAKSTSGYVDKDKVVSINYVGSQYPTTLIEGFGIGHNKTTQPIVISADGLGDSYSIVYYKADNSWGHAASYDEGYQFADSEGHWSYTMSNNTFCKFIAYIPASSAIQKGDVNVDGEVTIADVVMMVNYILGSTDNAANVLKYGDMDDSGEVNISDVVALVNKILE
ncbi:MAG: dockerin type I repeat-containing protein, partial [Bacteroidaceae bacterium]|nr:dockerin type I repeat-containing protein [Bacteroidaceae bacterium]